MEGNRITPSTSRLTATDRRGRPSTTHRSPSPRPRRLSATDNGERSTTTGRSRTPSPTRLPDIEPSERSLTSRRSPSPRPRRLSATDNSERPLTSGRSPGPSLRRPSVPDQSERTLTTSRPRTPSLIVTEEMDEGVRQPMSMRSPRTRRLSVTDNNERPSSTDRSRTPSPSRLPEIDTNERSLTSRRSRSQSPRSGRLTVPDNNEGPSQTSRSRTTSLNVSTEMDESGRPSTSRSPSPRRLSVPDSTRRPATTGSPIRPRSARQEETDEQGEEFTTAYLRSEMRETDSCKEINLSNRSLNEIPPAIFRIEEVEVLDVSDNPLGSIPINIGSISNLREMRAAGCDIQEISGNISKCKYLTKIDFSRNPHIAKLPATMKKLAYLKYLTLSGCDLQSLPENLTLLAKIETLDLSKNSLSTLPSDFTELKRMKVLILNDNVFRSIPEAIQSLGRLDCLEMKRNKLNNHKSDLVLNVPPKLKILDMEENVSLRLLPEGIENLEVVESLNFSYCGIQTLPDSIGQLSTLKEFHLAGNKLRTLPDSFGRLLNLETLDLEGNRRLSRLPLSLHHLRKLKDKETGTKKGMVLNDAPLDFPEPNIVKEGVTSILTELLVEESLNYVTETISKEVADEIIVEGLTDSVSDDTVTIVEEGLPDDLMLYMIDVAMDVERGCKGGVIEAVAEEDALLFVEEYERAKGDMQAVGAAWTVMVGLLEEANRSMTKEVVPDAAAEVVLEDLLQLEVKDVATSEMLDAAAEVVLENLLQLELKPLVKEVAESAVLDDASKDVLEDLLLEVTNSTAKSVALEVEGEWRLGQTVPDEYDKRYSYKISTNTSLEQSVDLPAGCNLSIPPGAAHEDSAIISVVLNPHGYAGTLMIGDNEQLVSDIIEMGPAGKTFAKPVKLKIPHSLLKFNREREYVVMKSDDNGTTWSIMTTLSEADQSDRHVTVEVTYLSTYAVVARPLEHSHRVQEGEASTLRSSEQTGIEVSLPADSAPDGEEISIQVTPVGSEALNCAEQKDAGRMSGMDSMSHIVRVVKGSNLLLNRPATIWLPLSPGREDSKVRVLSCNQNGEWEDVTDKVDDVVLKESKVAFKTNQLSSGYTVICCDESSDASGMVNLVANSVRARYVRTVIFKKWMEPKEEGIMAARMEAVLEESVDDRICLAKVDKYELQEGTPTPSVSMLENETFCALFNGNLLPDVSMVNNQYGQNFKFYCDRTNRLEFNLKLVGKSRDVRSKVHIFPGLRELYHPCERGETAATPLATAEITAPTGNICDYWLACRRFKTTLEIEDSYFNPDEDRCFCERCHTDREERPTYLRGRPKKRYALPVGWCRFGLSLQPTFRDSELNVFGNWHRAYHGTKQDVVKLILRNSSMLLMPGDVAMGGHQLGERPGHFTASRRPEGFDTVQVFVSPSIVYAGLDQYATPVRYEDAPHSKKVYKARVAFQLCIRPGSYSVGPETVGARRRGETIDPLFSNDELEWSTVERGGFALYGLLVKLEEQ